MTLSYLLSITWAWLTGTGLTLALLLVIALLIPRVGRFALWFANRRIDANEESPDEGKTQRALVGVSVYIVQLIAFFVLSVFFLQALGFSLTGAAIPATVVSAAIGFGAQSIIADFLAGFFILTEKQFGVGDWVRFEGNGIEVEGTIIQVTMRATRIRTLAQETVIIPNSTARVCINTSNYWSRAVVVIPVPLLGSADASDAIDRSEAATRRALAREEVAAELLGELDVQPAVSIQPPTVVGMPWMVDMRFMIQVTAGNQWMVERAIRSEILDEFWDEYGSATTTTGELRDQLTTAQIPVPQETSGAFDKAPLIDVPVDSPDTEATEHEDTTRITPIPAPRPVAADDTEVMPAAGAKENNPELNPPIPPGHSDEQGRDPARTPSETMESSEEAREASETKVMDSTADEDAEEVPRWRRILTFGGRLRLSTTVLLGLLVILLALRASTVEPTEEWLETRETAEVTEDGEGVEEPTTPADPTETQPTEPAESPTQAPTATTPQTPTPEGTPAPGTSPTGPAEQPNQTGQQEAPQNTGTTPAPGTPAPQQPAPNQGPAQEPGNQVEPEPAPVP